MTSTDISSERRRKNVRLALILAGIVLFMLITAIPFWRGLYNMVMISAQ